MPGNLRAGLVVLVATLVIGTAGFVGIEDLALLDAFYMTVITITTVGFGEIGGTLSTAGRMWTILVIVAGMGAALYTAFVGLEYFAENAIGGKRHQRRMKKNIEELSGHIVLCGFGRVGETAFESLLREDAAVVVIDNDPAKIDLALATGAYALEGDATSDEKLLAAGVERAKVLIPAVASDSDNLVITLSARALNPSILIVARAVNAETVKKLYLAGADRVVAPQVVGGERIATLALKPNLAEFIDFVIRERTVEFQVEELSVEPDSAIIGKSLRDLDLRRQSGALVLAIGDPAGTVSLNPSPDHVFANGQILIGIGTEPQLTTLRRLVGVES